MPKSQQDSKKDTTVRLPVEQLDDLRPIAAFNRRSLRAEVRHALDEYIAAHSLDPHDPHISPGGKRKAAGR